MLCTVRASVCAMFGESICMAMSGKSFDVAILDESIGMAKFGCLLSVK